MLLRVPVQIARRQEVKFDDWLVIKRIISEKTKSVVDLNEETDFLDFLKASVYVDRDFIEIQLIDLYKKSKLYTDKALQLLASINSRYAYREMLSFMLTSENRKERYKYAVKLMMSYRENGVAIYNYARDLNDEKLLKTLDEVAQKFNIQTSFEIKYKNIDLAENVKMQVLPHDTILSEFLFDLAKEINATTFYAAVGFTFSSGLRMLQPLLEFVHGNSGEVELITGSLQNFETNGKNTKIDKGTVIYLNRLIETVNLHLYTYTNAFYHGKMFYLANSSTAYIIIGSSNISKTAFLDNYELDMFITFDLNSNENQYLQWYTAFKANCTKISQLEISLYDDFKWESEQDIYSSSFVRKMSYEEITLKITELSDEETQFRLKTWMHYNPSEIFSNLNISSLPEYIVFLYAEQGLAVFESFIPGNAYYTFRYYDFDVLLQNVSALTKTQMLLSSSFVNRGYHISDKDRLEHRIESLFI